MTAPTQSAPDITQGHFSQAARPTTQHVAEQPRRATGRTNAAGRKDT